MEQKKEPHFLTSENVAAKMISGMEVTPADIIIEVEPGAGMLSKKLSELEISRLVLVVIDPELVVRIRRDFEGSENIQIVFADVINWLPDYVAYNGPNENVKITGVLPDDMTAPFLELLTKIRTKPQTAVFVVQKNVAQDLTANPEQSSPLAKSIQASFDVEYLEDVLKNSFYPIPQTDFGIIKLSKKSG